MQHQITIGTHKNGKPINIPQAELIDKGAYIVGIRKSGKTYKAQQIIKQLTVPTVIIDSTGEYTKWAEKERIPNTKTIVMRINSITISTTEIIDLTRSGTHVIIDFHLVPSHQRIKHIKALSQRLYQQGMEDEQPTMFVIDEAEKYLPQGKGSIKELEELAYTGRHARVGMLIVGHRWSALNKDILSQIEYRMIKKQTSDTDLKRIDQYIQALTGERNNTRQIATLKINETYYVTDEKQEVIMDKDMDTTTQERFLKKLKQTITKKEEPQADIAPVQAQIPQINMHNVKHAVKILGVTCVLTSIYGAIAGNVGAVYGMLGGFPVGFIIGISAICVAIKANVMPMEAKKKKAWSK